MGQQQQAQPPAPARAAVEKNDTFSFHRKNVDLPSDIDVLLVGSRIGVENCGKE